MKFDKDVIIGIVICVVLLFGWEPFARRMGWITPPVRETAQTQTAAAPETGSAPAKTPAAPVISRPDRWNETRTLISDCAVVPAEKHYVPVTIKGKDIAVTFDPNTGSVAAVTMEDYFKARPRIAPESEPKRPLDFQLAAGGEGLFYLQPGSEKWDSTIVLESKQEGLRYTLKRQLNRTSGNARLIVTHCWEVPASGYRIRCTVTVTNDGMQPLTLRDLQLKGGMLPPWQQLSGDKIRYDVQRLGCLTTQKDFNDVKGDAKEGEFFQKPQVCWSGVGNKYFVVLLSGKEPYRLSPDRRVTENKDEYLLGVNADLGETTLAPGAEKTWEFQSYVGPKIASQLENFAPEAQRMLHLTWGPLDYLARLLLWILVKLNLLVRNYGVSIIILTLIVRLIFYPVTAKANASMKKMQNVTPKLKEIRDKYKNDPQKMNQLTMELYRKEGVNPFGGCLPILLQIPVFFALYATLDGAVQLRQASFLWAHDLAAPDTVAYIPLYFCNLPVNPLVLAMTLLMVIQQRMTPMSMDPMQKKMMMLMPVVMLFVLYELPSGLTLYWTVSNLFSIIQLRLQQRHNPPPAENAGKA